MGEKRLKSLALLSVHREIKLDLENIIDRFALKHPRRMMLVDILNSDNPEKCDKLFCQIDYSPCIPRYNVHNIIFINGQFIHLTTSFSGCLEIFCLRTLC